MIGKSIRERLVHKLLSIACQILIGTTSQVRGDSRVEILTESIRLLTFIYEISSARCEICCDESSTHSLTLSIYICLYIENHILGLYIYRLFRDRLYICFFGLYMCSLYCARSLISGVALSSFLSYSNNFVGYNSQVYTFFFSYIYYFRLSSIYVCIYSIFSVNIKLRSSYINALNYFMNINNA